MKKPFSIWLLLAALAAQLVSPAVSALAITGNGVWSISCSGNPILLPVPSDKGQLNQHHHNECYLCCDEPRNSDAISNTVRQVQHTATATLTYHAFVVSAAEQRIKRHPTRAPPALQ